MKSLHLPSSTSMVVATSPFYSIVYFCDPLSTCHHWRLSPLLALWTTFLLPSWISQATLHESGCQSKTYYVVLLCCQEGLSFPFVSYLSRDGCAATMDAHVCLKLITIYHEKALSPSNLVFFFFFRYNCWDINTPLESFFVCSPTFNWFLIIYRFKLDFHETSKIRIVSTTTTKNCRNWIIFKPLTSHLFDVIDQRTKWLICWKLGYKIWLGAPKLNAL